MPGVAANVVRPVRRDGAWQLYRPLEEGTADRLAFRLPPFDHPVRTKRLAPRRFLGLVAALTSYKKLAELAT